MEQRYSAIISRLTGKSLSCDYIEADRQSRYQCSELIMRNLNMKLFVLISAVVAVTQAGKLGTKGASPFTNLGCQCDSLTFMDSYGKVQGNCCAVI